ncbi:hypothetical protein NM688_g3860 [Phlebia brevispora]|uniref:Uncharacterized protein n=1 Tax=Phlebia brevispora TaxID=194682 RepID=A0ACC1T4Q9_9APHY|nr:hypothetical protein NM688_g3860 [Phlebia brevispora]
MSSDQLRQLIPFLRDRNPQVRQIALTNLLGHTAKDSPHRDIFLSDLQAGGLKKSQDSDVIRDLKLLCRDQLATAHDAFRALVNLSDNSLVASSLSEPTFMNFLVSYILNAQATLADLASMILSNITTSAATCSTLLSMKVEIIPDPRSPTKYYPTNSRSGTCAAPVPYPSGDPKEVFALPLLSDAFLQGAAVEEENDPDKRPRKSSLHFLSSVFANISITPAGRMFFLTPRSTDPWTGEGKMEYPLTKLLVFTEHKDVIRRGGVASTMKHCAFQKEAHRAMLLPETEMVAVPPSTVVAPGMDILSYLLLPLAGPEEFDLEVQDLLPPALQFLPATKTREPDAVIRMTHVETLLLLCTTFWGREYLRAHGVYEIVRALHENEKDDKVGASSWDTLHIRKLSGLQIAEQVVRIVSFLKRDESHESRKDGEHEHETAPQNEEDEDEQIVEV